MLIHALPSRRQAFTLLELLVVVGIIALLIAVLLPSLNRARENANRSKCGTNLHAIGRALTLYAASESDMFPAQPPPDSSISLGIGLWNNPPNPFQWPDTVDEAIRNDFDTSSGGWFPQMGDPAANLWLLVLRGNVGPKQFICPSDSTIPRVSVVSFGPPLSPNVVYNDNFGAADAGALVGNYANTLSYSFAYPWYAELTDPGKWWKSTMDASLPIGSDMAPSGVDAANDPTGPPGQSISNSKNHSGGLGQNVLFADGHIDFLKTNRVGQSGDNIFTAQNDTDYVSAGGTGFNTVPTLPQVGPFDIIMVPARP